MSIKLPDNLFPAVVFLIDTPPTKPIIFTVLIYNTQHTPLYVAWFHENQIDPITVYKEEGRWIDKKNNKETDTSRAIGLAIENYNPFK
ncbi:MAG: hypothetical protein R3342_07145 [Lutibacter sp.]|uniref:hypothetical protein n=1 Tax=Lutibacter sp. TaxID=1925666 RepID=UPI00299D0A97|nr:hypothetical protein [Lutibacter sp.]MDX1829306.1 hypothetical protein [Lutibacter sp.]